MANAKVSVEKFPITGGAGFNGAAEYMQQVAGDMNAQHAGPNGSLQYAPVSGGGLEQMAVPALLFLANNAAPKWMGRKPAGNITYKKGGKKSRKGGFIVSSSKVSNDIKVSLLTKIEEITDDYLKQRIAAIINQANSIEVLKTELNNLENIDDTLKADLIKIVNDNSSKSLTDQLAGVVVPGLVNSVNSGEQNGDTPNGEQQNGETFVGGSLLQQAIVPATLVLANNMFGKRGKANPFPRYTKRRSNRRRNNRRKRASRRFRRGTR